MVGNMQKKIFCYVREEIWICLSLVCMVIAVYCRVSEFGFIDYDTDIYVYKNSYVRAGLTYEGFKWAFSTMSFSNWHPITWLSHMLDVELYGLDAGQHHLTSVIIHTVNSVMLFFALRNLTGKVRESGMVAALFAIHPLHIESVAWIAERKDVLSAFFFFLCLLIYDSYVKRKTILKYLLLCMSFALGLMCKPMLVTLPLVLLLLDYWPLSRFSLNQKIISSESGLNKHCIGKLFRRQCFYEKLPLIFMSLLFSFVTILAQDVTIISASTIPFDIRLGNALTSYSGYIIKMFYPINLPVIYPYHVPEFYKVFLSFLLLIGISFVSFRTYRSMPWLVTGWAWYLITAIPIIGLLQVGDQSMANRYTYIPLIGIYMILSWGACYLLRHHRVVIVCLFSIIIIVLMNISIWQLQFWSNSLLLFQRTLEITNQNYVAETSYGHQQLKNRNYEVAIKHFEKALEINPTYMVARWNLAVAWSDIKKPQKAIFHYRSVLKSSPSYALAHYLLAKELVTLLEYEQALYHIGQVIDLSPNYVDAYLVLAAIHENMQNKKKALTVYSHVLLMDPENEFARNKIKELKGD